MAENGARDMQLVVFRLGKEEYGADISQVREIIRVGDITGIPQASGSMRGVINLRGKVTTVIDLRRQLGMEERAADDNSRIVIMEAGTSSVGMMVDSVTEVKYINSGQIQECSGILAGSQGQSHILGICKLKDRLLILIDLKNVLDGVMGNVNCAS
jgi:purine-binding chemotaxis protein CheW